jgi:hypothetical protein
VVSGVVAGVRVSTAVAECPLRAALIVTDVFAVTTPALAANVAVAAPAPTVTEAGVLRAALLSEIVTCEPPAGAPWVRVTVQVLVQLLPRVVGLQANEETITGASRLRLVLAEVPLYVAVSVAL